MTSLEEQKDFIPLSQQSLRQQWGDDFLKRSFYKAGRNLEDRSWQKDLESIDFLLEAGYKPAEIAPILRHFNAVIEWTNAQGHEAIERYTASIRRTVHCKLFTWFPPSIGQ